MRPGIVSVVDREATSLAYTSGKVQNYDGVIVDKISSYNINSVRIANMVNQAVLKLSGKTSIGKAWESFFPAGHPNEQTKIGIKLNFSYGDWRGDQENDWAKQYCPFGPKAEVTNAIVSGLCQMMDGHFPIENITLVERMYSVGLRKYYPLVQGYRPVFEGDDGLFKDRPEGAEGMHWIYAASELELPPESPSFIAAPDYPTNYQAPQRIYKGIADNDFMINYAIAKDHRAAGITGVMKNNYGCTDNPVGTHGTKEWREPGSPYAGTRLCVPVFQKNIHANSPYILNVLDALTGVYHGGPLSGQVFQGDEIAVSQDPVAIDKYLFDMINAHRTQKGLNALSMEEGWTGDGHPNAGFLRIAAENHELGSLSQENVQKVNLTEMESTLEVPSLDKPQSQLGAMRRNGQNYELDVVLDQSGRSRKIESWISNTRGKRIKNFTASNVQSERSNLTWDHRTDENKVIKEGIYTWFVQVDDRLHSYTINDFTKT